MLSYVQYFISKFIVLLFWNFMYVQHFTSK